MDSNIKKLSVNNKQSFNNLYLNTYSYKNNNNHLDLYSKIYPYNNNNNINLTFTSQPYNNKHLTSNINSIKYNYINCGNYSPNNIINYSNSDKYISNGYKDYSLPKSKISLYHHKILLEPKYNNIFNNYKIQYKSNKYIDSISELSLPQELIDLSYEKYVNINIYNI